MSKSFKANGNFSFAGKVYQDGQAVNITDEDVIAKLQERGQIVSGQGTSDEDIQKAADAEAAKKTAAADKQREEEAAAREKEFLDKQTKPRSSVTMKVDDQTGQTQQAAAKTTTTATAPAKKSDAKK